MTIMNIQGGDSGAGVCVCVYVCVVCVRERERECVCVCVCVYDRSLIVFYIIRIPPKACILLCYSQLDFKALKQKVEEIKWKWTVEEMASVSEKYYNRFLVE